VSVEEKPLFGFLKKDETKKQCSKEVEMFLLVLSSIYGLVMLSN
jgi:hypothetical protein